MPRNGLEQCLERPRRLPALEQLAVEAHSPACGGGLRRCGHRGVSRVSSSLRRCGIKEASGCLEQATGGRFTPFVLEALKGDLDPGKEAARNRGRGVGKLMVG
jgi:hypothetical protein